jgi:hypothetical protein
VKRSRVLFNAPLTFTLFSFLLATVSPLFLACASPVDAAPDAVCSYAVLSVAPMTSCQNPDGPLDDAGEAPSVYGWMVSCVTSIDGEAQPLPASAAGCSAVPSLNDAPSPAGTEWLCCSSGSFAKDVNP